MHNETPLKENDDFEKRIKDFLKRLPDEDLQKLAKTQDQLRFWRSNRSFYTHVSNCWSTLHKGEDDLLRPILDSGEIDQDTYDQIRFTTYFFKSLWELVQLSFPHVREALTKAGWGEAPSSAYELFRFAVWEISEERFSVCLKPYHEVSSEKYRKHHKLLQKAEDGEDLNPIEQKRLASFNKRELELTGIAIILSVCKKKATRREKVLKAKLDDCLEAIARLAACEAAQTWKQESFAWKNGQKIAASKYGGVYQGS